MNRRTVDGILVLNKPQGMGSNQALQRVKKIFSATKAGHTGNLDPLATGVLPLCFGKATKLVQYVLNADKQYRCVFQLGTTTTTGDIDGTIVEQRDYSQVTLPQLRKVLRNFIGDIRQIPPMYSAIKYRGQPLYKLARQGITVERPMRTVTIYDIALVDFAVPASGQITVDIKCSKGTYIRTLAEDIGTTLSCGGCVLRLHRTMAGNYSDEQSITMQQLTDLSANNALSLLDKLLLPMSSAVSHLPRITLENTNSYYFCRGQAIQYPYCPWRWVTVFTPNDRFIGVGEVLEGNKLTPRRVFS